MIDLKKLCDEKGLVNIDIGEFSDGFHTFNSLAGGYEWRFKDEY